MSSSEWSAEEIHPGTVKFRTATHSDVCCNTCGGDRVIEHHFDNKEQRTTNYAHETCRHQTRECCEIGGKAALSNWLNIFKKPASGRWHEAIILPSPENTQRDFKPFITKFINYNKEQSKSLLYNKIALIIEHIYDESGTIKKHRRTECDEEANVTHLHILYIKIHEKRGINNVLRRILQETTLYQRKQRGTKFKTTAHANSKLQYLLQGHGRFVRYDKVFARNYQSIAKIHIQDGDMRDTGQKPKPEDSDTSRRGCGSNSSSNESTDGSFVRVPKQCKETLGERGDTTKSNEKSTSESQGTESGRSLVRKRRRDPESRRYSSGSSDCSDSEIIKEKGKGGRDKLGRFVKCATPKTNTNVDNNDRRLQNLTSELMNWVLTDECRAGTVQLFKKYIIHKTMHEKKNDLLEIATLMNKTNFERNLQNSLQIKQVLMQDSTWVKEMASIEALSPFANNYFYPEFKYYNKYFSARAIAQCLHFNGINVKEFIDEIEGIINKVVKKKNTLFIQGPPNSGKTTLCQSIRDAFVYASSITNFSKGEGFPCNDTIGMRIATADELIIEAPKAAQALLVLEGKDHMENQKYCSKSMQERIPILATGNKPLWYACPAEANAIQARIKYIHFKANPLLKKTAQKLWHPLGWMELIRIFQKIRLDEEYHFEKYRNMITAMIKELEGNNEEPFKEEEKEFEVGSAEETMLKDLTCNEAVINSEEEEEESIADYLYDEDVLTSTTDAQRMPLTPCRTPEHLDD